MRHELLDWGENSIVAGNSAVRVSAFPAAWRVIDFQFPFCVMAGRASKAYCTPQSSGTTAHSAHLHLTFIQVSLRPTATSRKIFRGSFPFASWHERQKWSLITAP